MKSMLRMGCSALMLAMAVAGTAQAAEQKTIVRSAQEQLNGLGYYSGPVDGVVGHQTQAAISDFQRANGLAVTGSLTPETYHSLAEGGYYNRYTGYYGYHYNGINGRYAGDYKRYSYGYSPYRGATTYYQQAATDWNGKAYALPMRFGHMVVSNDGANNFTVTLNGQPVLYANNQPNPLKVSRTYSMSGEDAVILTAYSGAHGCMYKNYLVTVKSDGTYIPAQEIANCRGDYQARVDGNQLFVSFPERFADSVTKDNWRYGYNSLVRL